MRKNIAKKPTFPKKFNTEDTKQLETPKRLSNTNIKCNIFQ